MIGVLAKQMLVMGIFMIIGAILFKAKLITKEGNKTLTSLLIYLVTPVTVFRSLCVERTPETLKAFVLSVVLGALVLGLGVLFARIAFRKKPVVIFAASFPNAGFFGIPVISAVLGPEAVFYMAPLAVYVGILQHTYGVSLLLGTKSSLNWKRILLAPGTISLCLGSLVFLTGLGTKLPPITKQCIDSISGMNGFLAMSILGIFIVQADFSQLYKNIEIYVVSALRTLVFPLICAVVLRFIPAPYMMKMTILLAFAGPVGSNVANYALLYDKDYSTSCLYVVASTILCLITLPLFSAIIEKIL